MSNGDKLRLNVSTILVLSQHHIVQLSRLFSAQRCLAESGSYTTFSLFIHLLMDTGCFHVLAIVNNTAMNIGMWILLEVVISFPLDIYPEVGLLEHMVVLFLIF